MQSNVIPLAVKMFTLNGNYPLNFYTNTKNDVVNIIIQQQDFLLDYFFLNLEHLKHFFTLNCKSNSCKILRKIYITYELTRFSRIPITLATNHFHIARQTTTN